MSADGTPRGDEVVVGAGGFPGVARLPFSLKILLENLLRHEDGRFVKAVDIEALARQHAETVLAGLLTEEGRS